MKSISRDTELTETVDRIVAEIQSAGAAGHDWRLHASKPRGTSYVKGRLTPFLDSKKRVVGKAVMSSETQDFTKVIEPEELGSTIRGWLDEDFFFMEFHGPLCQLFVRQNKKGRLNLSVKGTSVQTGTIASHNKSRNYLVREDAAFLKLLGLSSDQGKLYDRSRKKFKQINKFLEIVKHLLEDRKISRVVDMGCGKGYLTFGMYDLLTREQGGENIQVVGVEIRDSLTVYCNSLAEKAGFEGLQFVTSDILTYEVGSADLLVALHACDTATDVAIWKGVQAGVDVLILSPCCHKQIRKQMSVKNAVTRHGIYEERTAEMVTDTIRALLLEVHGYQTKIFEFVGSEHTAKNTMITAVKGRARPQAAEEIAALKEQYGIQAHYLESLFQAL